MHDHVLMLLRLLLQMLKAAKEGAGSTEGKGQMPLRNSKIFCQCSVM